MTLGSRCPRVVSSNRGAGSTLQAMSSGPFPPAIPPETLSSPWARAGHQSRAESSGQSIQAGVRYFVIKDLLQIDATLGGQIDGPTSGRWISFGLRYLPQSALGP